MYNRNKHDIVQLLVMKQRNNKIIAETGWANFSTIGVKP